MKLNKLNTDGGMLIPPAALRIAKFEAGEPVEYHVHDGVIVTLRSHMTAAQLTGAAYALHEMFVQLSSHLAEACGQCTDCLDVCPFKPVEEAGVVLPDFLRQEAGLSEDSLVYASVNEDEHTVTVAPASLSNLENVPPDLLDMLENANVCLGALDDLIASGDVIYGG